MSVQIVLSNGTKKSLNGLYVGDAAGNFRLRLYGIFGILGMDLCSRSGQITGYMPTRNFAFQNSTNDVEVSNCLELILLGRIGQARELFFPRAWDREADGRRVSEASPNLLKVDVLAPRSIVPLRQVWVDPEQGVVTAQDMFNFKGEAIGNIHYSKFVPQSSIETQKGSSDGPDDTQPIPTSIHVVTSKISFHFTLESITLNQVIDSDAFHLTLPDHIQLTPLDKLASDGAGLFSK